ncbi:tail fiber protein [Bordetella ansorpii]|uniref:Tail fiber protein n=1 Tax=Bordetella ansorpii TaxID=288768 RepID=A0A157SX75_9BORD|nr:hypothetical protein [Bordetella ansorpii]SAI74556.1 tail fiber protein [Bordetella ansorpii]
MSTPLQLRGGTAGEHETFTGKVREVTVNTTRGTLHVHDGQTPRGFELARVDRTMPVMSMATVTALTADVGPVWVIEAQDVWVWVPLGTYWTGGYRSAKLGEYEHGWSRTARPWQIAAEGAWLNETTYPGKHLLAWAQENGLLVAAASYVVGAYNFARSGGQIRVPDMRNMFDRAYGTDADTANARTLGSRQSDAMQRLNGGLGWVGRTATSQSASGVFSDSPFNTVPVGNSGTVGGSSSITFDSAFTARSSSETRSLNAAYAPRIHV